MTGYLADFVVVDLDVPSLARLDAESLLEGLIFGAGDGAIVGTMVGGDWRESGAAARHC